MKRRTRVAPSNTRARLERTRRGHVYLPSTTLVDVPEVEASCSYVDGGSILVDKMRVKAQRRLWRSGGTIVSEDDRM